MSDTTESSRQATHAHQEGVDDNVAALAERVIGTGAGVNGDLASTLSTMDDSMPTVPDWSSSVKNATGSSAAKKIGGEISARWVAAGMGIGSAALVAALLYANRNNERKRDKR